MFKKRNKKEEPNQDTLESLGIELVSWEEYEKDPQKYGSYSGTLPKKTLKSLKFLEKFKA